MFTEPYPSQVLTQRLVEAVAVGGPRVAEEDSLSGGIYCSMAACFQSSVIRQARQAEAMQLGGGVAADGSSPPINPIATFVRCLRARKTEI